MGYDEFDYKGEQQYYAHPVTEVRAWRWMARDMVLWVPDFPEVFKGKLVLDIGAGECLATFVVSEMGAAKYAVALDLFPYRMYAASKLGLRSTGFLGGDCYSLPFKDSLFDIVIGNGVLHHLPGMKSVAKEIKRVLRQGGFYFGREPNFLNPLVRRRVLGGRHSPNEYPILPEEIRAAFSSEGFKVQLRYFWRRIPWLRHPRFSVSIAIVAVKT